MKTIAEETGDNVQDSEDIGEAKDVYRILTKETTRINMGGSFDEDSYYSSEGGDEYSIDDYNSLVLDELEEILEFKNEFSDAFPGNMLFPANHNEEGETNPEIEVPLHLPTEPHVSIAANKSAMSRFDQEFQRYNNHRAKNDREKVIPPPDIVFARTMLPQQLVLNRGERFEDDDNDDDDLNLEMGIEVPASPSKTRKPSKIPEAWASPSASAAAASYFVRRQKWVVVRRRFLWTVGLVSLAMAIVWIILINQNTVHPHHKQG